MKTRQPQEVLSKIDAFIVEQLDVDFGDQFSLIKYVESVIERPDEHELISDYCRKLVNSRIAGMKDNEGYRKIFSNGDRKKPRYINMKRASTANLDDLRLLLGRQRDIMIASSKNVERIENLIAMLENQVSFADIAPKETDRPLYGMMN